MKRYLFAAAATLMMLQMSSLRSEEYAQSDEEVLEGLVSDVTLNRSMQLEGIDNFVERVAGGEIPGFFLGLPEGSGPGGRSRGQCATNPNCRVYQTGQAKLKDGRTINRDRALSPMEVSILAGVNPGSILLNNMGVGLLVAQQEVNRHTGGEDIGGVLGTIGRVSSGTSEPSDELWIHPHYMFAAFGVAMIHTASAVTDADASLRNSNKQMQNETNQEAAMFSQLNAGGVDNVNGTPAKVFRATNVSMPAQTVEDQQFVPTGASIWIDPENLVLLKHRIEGVMTAEGESRDFFIEVESSDYRNPEGCGELYQPYRRVMRMGGILNDKEMAEMQEARLQLEEFDRQMASMPANQRAMMENMVGRQMDTVRGLAKNGAFEHVEEIEEVICNPDLKALFSVPGPASPEDLLRQIQVRLVALGYEPGNTDGELDTMTQIAISQFQAEHGLPVTGEPSEQLLEVLASL